VQDGVYDAFAAKLAVEAPSARCGSATVLAGVTDQGPLIDAKALAKVEEHIADAVARARRSPTAASATRSAAPSSSPPSSRT
jgi:succinate-semialdehyde dehydrogenase/glutarate-semialdehyde dehydrogenase